MREQGYHRRGWRYAQVIIWSLFDHCWLVILWEQRCYRWGWRYAQVGIWISYGNLLVAFIKQDFWTFCRQRVIASRGGRSKRLTIKINIFCLLCEFLGQESGLHNVNCIYIYCFLHLSISRYALQGSRWKTKDLTYKITKYPKGGVSWLPHLA